MLDTFTPQHLRNDNPQSGACGLLGQAGVSGIASGFGAGQQAAMGAILAQRDMSWLTRNSAATGALRDGTGKIVTHPETFIEELQAETNEWLGDAWD